MNAIICINININIIICIKINMYIDIDINIMMKRFDYYQGKDNRRNKKEEFLFSVRIL